MKSSQNRPDAVHHLMARSLGEAKPWDFRKHSVSGSR